MSQNDKLKRRLLQIPSDFTYKEMRTLLESMGFVEKTKGKTSGSRSSFFREKDGASILLHKPHPGDEMKKYAVRQVVDYLKELGEL